MKILDVLPKEAILADLKAADKKGVLEELVVPVADISGGLQNALECPLSMSDRPCQD